MWLDEAALPNTPPPIALDVNGPWPRGRYDASSAPTRCTSWAGRGRALFAALPGVLDDDATLAIYGPFNLGGTFTSESNAAFDASLRARDPRQGCATRKRSTRSRAPPGSRISRTARCRRTIAASCGGVERALRASARGVRARSPDEGARDRNLAERVAQDRPVHRLVAEDARRGFRESRFENTPTAPT
jgi:hypothetical protein